MRRSPRHPALPSHNPVSLVTTEATVSDERYMKISIVGIVSKETGAASVGN